MQLTAEDFERILSQKLETMASKHDLAHLATVADLQKLGTEVQNLGTDVRRLSTRIDGLEAHVDTQIEGLAQMVAAGFQDLQQRLDVRDAYSPWNGSSRNWKKPST